MIQAQPTPIDGMYEATVVLNDRAIFADVLKIDSEQSRRRFAHAANQAARQIDYKAVESELAEIASDIAAKVQLDGIAPANALVRSRPVLLTLSDVQPEPVQWLWAQRIGLGKLTLLAGDPGLGKSFITLDMAARVSTGTAWPDSPGMPIPVGGVVLLSAEDDPADTIRPRLDAAQGDVSRIKLLQAVKDRDPDTGVELEKAFCLTRDLPALELAIEDTPGCRLVVIDPITAYLGSTDSHKNADIRGVLAPLAELARRYAMAIVAVTHLNKSSTMPAMYRSMGSLAFVAAARAAWAVIKDKDDPTGRRRLLLPIKNNLGDDQTGLAYALAEENSGVPRVAWEPDPVTLSADEMLRTDGLHDNDRGDREQAAEWLRDALADGSVRSTDLIRQAKDNGIAEKTLRRAFKDLGGKPRKASFDGGWYWGLPGDDGQVEPEDAQDAHPKSVGNFDDVGHLGGEKTATIGPQPTLYDRPDGGKETFVERAARLRKEKGIG